MTPDKLKHITQINLQSFQVDHKLKKDADFIRNNWQKHIKHQIKVQRGVEASTVQSLSGYSANYTQFEEHDSNFDGQESDEYLPNCFIWSGHLPPGKQSLIVYDRYNKTLMECKCLIELGPEVTKVTQPQFSYMPQKKTDSQIQKLQEDYDTMVQIEAEEEARLAEIEAKYQELVKQRLAAKKKGKKGKGKKKK